MSEITFQKGHELEDIIQLVSFKIGNEEFGVDILKVQEINRMMEITTVPNAPTFVEGVVNLRGRIIPVIDLRTRLGMIKVDHSIKTRIIVVELVDKTVGFIVDEVNEVLRIPRSITEPPPEMVAGIEANYLTAVAKLEDRLLILLDLEKILDSDEAEQLSAMS
ncbi:MAG: purine-binding chemotaxis protein CheW [Chlorobi bacterium]|nr:purine-binding chemotaxis protein CheW [Chlorobiota bacterium]